MTDQDAPTSPTSGSGQPGPEGDVGYGSPADTRAPEVDDRRTPDDDRYGYGSEEGYEVEEGSPGASSGGGSKQPGEDG
ncbi:hypothetical protein [Deinococcus planocerae]|uniref:hypothetical protein n=1 Tax=Deinococcus planocerae TaxID=1737569 RepID=UPI000C7F5ABF|nr:hypothetical protein [Deinococcus planocerae]